MVRRLVWTCGGVGAVGVLVYLCVASAPHQADQAQAKPARAPSTPASATSTDPVLGIEKSIQQKFLKDGILVPPGPQASPAEVKAFDLVMEEKNRGAGTPEAIRAAAEKIWEEKKTEHDRRTQDRKAENQERAKLTQQMMRDRVAQKRAEHPEPLGVRETLPPKPGRPALPPAYTPDASAPSDFPPKQ